MDDSSEDRARSRRFRRKAAAGGAALAIGFVSTVVLAEWLANGTGEGFARATEAQALTTEDVDPAGTLYPGGTGDLVVTIGNSNPFAVSVTSVTGDGPITSDVPTCDAAGHGVAFVDQLGLSLAVPAASTETFTLEDAVVMSVDSADECQGALFEIPVALNGASGDGGEGGGGDPVTCDDSDPDTIDSYDENSEACVFSYQRYVDQDEDGYGSNTVILTTHPNAPGTSDNDHDCDDSSASVNPAAPEIPGNGIDDDCDTVTDE